MTYTFLALGDSYTIGEGLPLYENFPYQTVQILRKAGISFIAPEIVAKTGWTTDELSNRITETTLQPAYDFVSLLIGVNNEYRGRSSQEYAVQFEELLQQAIHFAGAQMARVFVLSIPDWSISPFANSYLPDDTGRDRATVAAEIDVFNGIARKIAGSYQVEFIDITPHSRSSSLFAPDGLHPSEQQYQYWAEQLAERIAERIKTGRTE